MVRGRKCQGEDEVFRGGGGGGGRGVTGQCPRGIGTEELAADGGGHFAL